MCDCFHLAFPNWHAASSGIGDRRRLQGPECTTEDESICEEPSQFVEGERPRPQGSSPVEEYPEAAKYTDSDKKCEAEHDSSYKSGSGHKAKRSGLVSMFERSSTPKVKQMKEVHSLEDGMIVETPKDGCGEGLIYGGGGKEGIFIKKVVPESPASKSLKVKEGDQILSATVYFDNVSFEDAVQILEHAQAYKVKLCLKRKPEITETEPILQSDTIPEEELSSVELRVKGKTKSREEARISWPKISSFGKERKSCFTRSHSTPEADEQRKPVLSPTTSDTESPVKTRDALKGKKKHKITLSGLTKRSRVGLSEEQNKDSPKSGQISGHSHQTQKSDMLLPYYLDSPSGETLEVIVTEDMQAEDNLMALADQGSLSGVTKTPDGKKKKKEKSEVKMKNVGKDKSPKKSAERKSPRRLKALGASFDAEDQPENEKSDVLSTFESNKNLLEEQPELDANTQNVSGDSLGIISHKSRTAQISLPKVELDISDVVFVQKSPQKEKKKKAQKGKDAKKKHASHQTGLSESAAKEEMQSVDVKESTAKSEQFVTESTKIRDPYSRLSTGSVSTGQLPKREDIEIPGMVAVPTKKIHKSKNDSTTNYEGTQAETVQLSIDVDSVKEAVSKLPGFKLPQVDTSGALIPEEKTVIDANAQRIFMRTRTKVTETRGKLVASQEIFKTTGESDVRKDREPTGEVVCNVKIPELDGIEFIDSVDESATKKDGGLTGFVIEIDAKPTTSVSVLEMNNENQTVEVEDQILRPPKQEVDPLVSSGDKKIIVRELEIKPPKKEAKGTKFKLPHLDVSVPKIKGSISDFSTSKKDVTVTGTKAKAELQIPEGPVWDASLDVLISEENTGEEKPEVEVKPLETQDELDQQASKGKTPKFEIEMPKIKDLEFDFNLLKKNEDGKAKVQLPEGHKRDVSPERADTFTSEQKTEVEEPDMKIQTVETQDKQGRRFKMPILGIKMPKIKGQESDLHLSKDEARGKLSEICLPETSESDVTPKKIDVCLPKQEAEVEKPEQEVKPLKVEVKPDVEGGKFKMPKFGFKMPKIKGPDFDIGFSKKDAEVTLPEVKAEVQLPESSKTEISLNVSKPQQKTETEKPEEEVKPLQTDGESDAEGGKFKMPKFEIKMPTIKGPEFDISSSKKDADISLPKAKAEVQIPESYKTEISLNVSKPQQKIEVEKPEQEARSLQVEGESDAEGGKFKMPKFGIKMPKIKGPDYDIGFSKKDAEVTLPGVKAEVHLPESSKTDVDIDISIPDLKMEVEKPEQEFKPLHIECEPDVEGGSFKMPKFGITMPKIKGPDFDISSPKKDADIRLPEAKAEVQLRDCSKTDFNIDVSLQDRKLEIEKPEQEVKPLQIEAKPDVEGGKFKMPKFGFKMPKIKGPDFDIGFSKKDAEVTLPEVKAEVHLPESSKTDVDIDISMPDRKMEVEKPEQEFKPLHIEREPDVEGGKFKMPKFGITMPKIKGPDFDISSSKKDADIRLPEVKAEVQLPESSKSEISVDVSLKDPKMKVEKPELEVRPLLIQAEGDVEGGSFKMPKFGITMPKIKGPDFDKSSSKRDADIRLPEAKAEVQLRDCSKTDFNIDVSLQDRKLELEKPEQEVKPLQIEAKPDVEGGKFKMPKFGFKMPKIKGPDFDIGFSKKDAEVTLPGVKAEVHLPESSKTDVDIDISMPDRKMEVEKPEQEFKPLHIEREPDVEGGKFKMPKFGITMPKIKGPDFDISSSKKDADIRLPEAKAEVQLPDCSKTDISVDVSLKDQKMEVEKPGQKIRSLQVEGETDAEGGKFKMPNFGIKMPKIKGPELNISFSKKEPDIRLPEAKAEVQLPDCSKTDFNIDVSLQDRKLEIEKPEQEVKPLQIEAKPDVEGGKFKMPKFGIKMPKIKGPELDIGFSKKEADISLPEVTAEVQLPESSKTDVDIDISMPDLKMEVEKPEQEFKPLHIERETDVEGGKFKMPKFGIKMPKIKGPELDIGFSKKEADISLPEAKAEVQLPESSKADIDIDISMPDQKLEEEKLEQEFNHLHIEGETDGQGAKFMMLKLGITMPQAKGPNVDLSSSKKDKESKGKILFSKTDQKESSTAIKSKAPEMKSAEEDVEGSPSKFKTPSFKMPTFGVTTPRFCAETQMKSSEKDITADTKTAETVLGSDVDTKAAEADGKKSRFKMSKLGISFPKLKSPEKKFNLSKKSVYVSLPEGRLSECEHNSKAPQTAVDVDVEGSPSKLNIMTFKDSKLRVDSPNISVETLGADKDVKSAGCSINVPEEELTVSIKGPSTDVETDKQTEENDFKRRKFQISPSSFSMPKIKGPKLDTSLSKPEKGVALSETLTLVKTPEYEGKALEIECKEENIKITKTGIQIPKTTEPEFHFGEKEIAVTTFKPKVDMNLSQVELKAPSTKEQSPAPEMKDETSSTFQMPNISFSASEVKGPDTDMDLTKKGTEKMLPDTKAEMKLPKPSKMEVSLGKVEIFIPEGKVEAGQPEEKIKPSPTHLKHKGQEGRFKMPKLGITMPKVKGPESDLDLSKTTVDGTLPEDKTEVKVLHEEIREPAGKLEYKAVEVQSQFPCEEQSQSKFKLPTFKLPKFRTAPEINKEIKMEDSSFKMPEDEDNNQSVKQGITVEGEGKDSTSRTFGMSLPKVQGLKIDLSLSNKETTSPKSHTDAQLPEAPEVNAHLGEVDLLIPKPNLEMKNSDVENKPLQPEGKLSEQVTSFKVPTFGVSASKLEAPQIDLGLAKTDEDVTIPKTKAEVSLPGADLDKPVATTDLKAAQTEPPKTAGKGSPSKYKLPTFKFPKIGVVAPHVSGKPSNAEKRINSDREVAMPSTDVDVPEAKAELHVSDVGLKVKEKKISVRSQEIMLPKETMFGINLSSSKKDEDLKVPEVEARKPSAEAEVKAPEVKAGKSKEGSPLKFKLGSLKFPKLGLDTPSFTKEERHSDKDGKVDEVDMKISVEVPSTQYDATSSLSKRDANVTIQEAKDKTQAPDFKAVTTDKERSPIKFRIPTFKLPNFGVGSTSVKESKMDKDVNVDGSDAGIPIEVPVAAEPKTDIQVKSMETNIQETEDKVRGSKFKLPSIGLSLPQAKGADIDLNLSNINEENVPATKTESKAEAKLSEDELNKSSAEVETKDPEIKVAGKNTEGSPSKFKMPSFKLPKFRLTTQSSTEEVPPSDKDAQTGEGCSEEVLSVTIVAPSSETEGPKVDIKSTETAHKGKGIDFKLPSLGFSVPKTKELDTDLNLKTDVRAPEAKAEANLPDKEPKKDSEMENKAPTTDFQVSNVEESPSKFKMPTFKLPRFGVSNLQASGDEPDMDKEIEVKRPSLKVEETKAEVKEPPMIEADVKVKKTSWTLPRFSFSKVNRKAAESDINLEVEETIPETMTEGHTSDVNVKGRSMASAVGETATDLDAKLKKSKFSVLKPSTKETGFDISVPKGHVSLLGEKVEEHLDAEVELPECETHLDSKEGKGEMLVKDLNNSQKIIDVTLPEVKAEGQQPSVRVKQPLGTVEVKSPKIKSQAGTVSADVDEKSRAARAKVKLLNVEVKRDERTVSLPDEPTVQVKASQKHSNWTFPKIDFSLTGGKILDADINLEKSKASSVTTKTKAEVCTPDLDVKGPSGVNLVEESHAAELDTNLKKRNFSLPRFSFSKSNIKEPEVKTEPLNVDTSVPDGGGKDEHQKTEIKVPGFEARVDDQVKLGDADFPQVGEAKEFSGGVETTASEAGSKSKDVRGSPLKFKMPSLKMPKFGSASQNAATEAHSPEKVAKTDGSKLKDATAIIKGPQTDMKTDTTGISDPETSTTRDDGEGHGSPGRFKLPTFKIPQLGLSVPKPEEHADEEHKDNQLKKKGDPKEEAKPPKVTSTSFDKIFKTIDVEFGVTKVEKAEPNLETSKKAHETDPPTPKHLEAKEKEARPKGDSEKPGGFKPSDSGLSSSLKPKIPEKAKQKDDSSPEGETKDEEVSPTCSVQSSDAFADISSTITSEPAGPFLPSPTKVTVKYSYPRSAPGLETHTDVFTSTTRTELISDVSNVSERIINLSSRVSSSFEDAPRPESGKIHISMSNIQTTSDARQPGGELPLESEAARAPLIGESQTVFERHTVSEISREKIRSKETLVITKQVTKIFDTSEPISGETASSLQRLKESVHSEKMRFFEEAEK